MRRILILIMAGIFMLSVPAVFALQAKERMGAKMGGMKHGERLSPEEMAKKDEERINARLEELTKNLSLTPEQQAKVKDIMAATSEKVREMMKDVREKVKNLIEKERKSIDAVLTEEQKANLKARHQKAQEERPMTVEQAGE